MDGLRRGDHAGALKALRTLAEQGLAEAQLNLGLLHYGQGPLQNPAEAAKWFSRAASQKDAAAQTYLGIMYSKGEGVEQDHAEAMRLFRLAAEQGFADAQVNLGWGYDQGRGVPADEGEALHWYTLAANQNNAEAWHNLGALHSAANRPVEAIACFDRALAIKPNNMKTLFNRAWDRLGIGDYARGWVDYEARFLVKRRPPRKLPGVRWSGENLGGKTLFLHTEQGFGDAMQFVRFALRVQKLGARVVLECHPKLYRLFQSLKGVDQLVRAGDAISAFDYFCPLASLPLALKLNAEQDFAVEVPYLRAPEGAGERLAAAPDLAAPRFKVGIAWSGNITYRGDHLKSTTLETFLPLADVPGVQLFSLQIGPRAEQLQALGGGAMIDLAPLIDDFADTAAAVNKLDLVISVDTSVAHLTGALGRPGWVVLPFVPDFRWLRNREDSPWYPSLRLFRMTRVGDWPGVIGRVAQALKEAAAKAS